jgi:geranylgeranyl transferase type-2 subunit beta
VNPRPSYLEELTIRLATGVGNLPEAVRLRHAAFLKSAQRKDGGFGGRMGESDLYYTSFGLRSLAILGELYGDPAQRAAAFLHSQLTHEDRLIDQMSLVFGAALLEASAGEDAYGTSGDAWKNDLATRIMSLRRADGGFAKGPDGAASSTYHTFLALICLQLIQRPLPDRNDVLRFIMSQQVEMGGFREIRASKRAGTNPTAAAIGVLRMFDALDPAICDSTAAFLADMQDDHGGLLANTRIPLADALSTFTGVLTLIDLGQLDVIDTTATFQFIQALENPQGGFLAAGWDEVCDVEYTFYGLGSLALLTTVAP